MKEYRVVTTLKTIHCYDGSEHYYEAASPRYRGRAHDWITRDLMKAVVLLNEAKAECKAFDKETQKRSDKNNIKYYQSNIRIQEREVSAWSDQ